MILFRNIGKNLFFIFLFSLLYGCNTTKFLEVDQVLLQKNVLHLDKKNQIENRRSLSYELGTLYKQKPNHNLFFFIPREWFFFKTSEQDSSRIAKWKKRFLAEPPAIFSDDLAASTALEMQNYLQYKGYYDAKAYFDETLIGRKKKKVIVHYYAEPNNRYTIDSVFLTSFDSETDSILQESSGQTLFKRGQGLDGKLYELEKDRISTALRNHGYAFFYPNNIQQMEVDTLRKNHTAKLYLDIQAPPGNGQRRYFVGDIVVLPNFNPAVDPSKLRDTLIEGLIFRDSSFDFSIKPEIIKNAVHLIKGDLYQDALFDLTNKQLGSLGVFRFVRIRQEVDSVFPNKLNFRIELTPTKRFEMGLDFDVNYTNRSSGAGIGNLIGISLSPSVRHRNLFQGAETLISKLSAGVEINPNPERGQFWNTIDLRFQTDLFWPRFGDYLGIWKVASPLAAPKSPEKTRESAYRFLSGNATTRLSGSWNYVSLLNFYNYTLINMGYGFDLQQPNKRFSVNHLGIDYLFPEFQEASDTIINENPFFRNSFSRQLFVSLLFRDLNLVTANRPNRLGISHYFSLSAETSGFELWAGNAIYNGLAGAKDTLKISGVPFSQFIRLDGDYRVYRQLAPKRSVAFRLNLGIVQPFGFSSDVHYVKQFASGGPNSIRGWAARELGPGGHIDSLSLTYTNPLFFYQTGDFKMEFNLEYRFNIFWALNGALFLDGGNIWTLGKDSTRPGSQFRFSELVDPEAPEGRGIYDPFYRQIALSPGLGVRLDFTYFIFRIDLGVKLRYPYRWDGKSFWNPPNKWLDNPNINLGLGLPF